jgi:hypothetical protein
MNDVQFILAGSTVLGHVQVGFRGQVTPSLNKAAENTRRGSSVKQII